MLKMISLSHMIKERSAFKYPEYEFNETVGHVDDFDTKKLKKKTNRVTAYNLFIKKHLLTNSDLIGMSNTEKFRTIAALWKNQVV